jgi:hypothetical protein
MTGKLSTRNPPLFVSVRLTAVRATRQFTLVTICRVVAAGVVYATFGQDCAPATAEKTSTEKQNERGRSRGRKRIMNALSQKVSNQVMFRKTWA